MVHESTTIGHYYEPIVVRASTNTGRPADLYRLLLRVGIKVADEWQISLDYVRGSNIYVRGYLDLRAWSLRLRTWMQENHCVKALFLHENVTFPSAG